MKILILTPVLLFLTSTAISAEPNRKPAIVKSTTYRSPAVVKSATYQVPAKIKKLVEKITTK